MKFVTLDLIEKMVKGIASKTAPKVHTHGDGDITDLDASKLTGTVAAERLPENLVKNTDDVSNTTVAFTSGDTTDKAASAWTSVATLTSGEKQSSLFTKVSQMFNNVRWINNKLGRAVLTGIGNGTVTDAISDINSNLLRSAYSNGSLDDALLATVDDPNSDLNWPYLIGSKTEGIPSDFHYGVREVLFLDTNYIIVRITGIATDGKSAIWTRAYTGTWESEWRRLAATDGQSNTKTIQTLTTTVTVGISAKPAMTAVTFENPFTNPPFVFVSPTYTAAITAMHIRSITTDGFVIQLSGSSNSQVNTTMQFLIVGD